MREKCGYRDMHWYQDGDTCQCGQVPKDIFFAASCSCDQWRMRKPIHFPDCAYVAWARRRNEWVRNHPEVQPPMDLVSIRIK